MHGSLFEGKDLVAKDLLKTNNATNTCLINMKIILFYS